MRKMRWAWALVPSLPYPAQLEGDRLEKRIRALYSLPPPQSGSSDKTGSSVNLKKAEMPEFETKIRTQYADIFREPAGLPPARKDGGFRIRTIPGAKPLHRSPY